MKVTALAPWFGSARMNASRIGEEIGKQDWVGIPFCGGCCEVPHIKARSIYLNDVHNHIVTLAMTVADAPEFHAMQEMLEDVLVHPAYLLEARKYTAAMEEQGREPQPDADWAAAYFTNVWISRSSAGTEDEFKQPLASRMTATGGSSVRRWRSALEALPEWHQVLKERCEFSCRDWRDWLEQTKDRPGHALYIDPPWQDAGKEYKHKFTEQDHRDLADVLHGYENCRVVIRHSDHPLYRELYPDWTWVELSSRNQANKVIREMLVTNKTQTRRIVKPQPISMELDNE